jgi:uncharacterized protein DUF6448
MPPHCDSLDGPVVTAARAAVAARDVNLVLPYVRADGEAEVRRAFERTLAARNGAEAVNDLADLYFFETVVRVHRAGEGAPYTGLKPAGLPVGPVIPVAERAVETGDPRELLSLLTDKVEHEVRHRLHEVMERGTHAHEGVEAARAHVEAMLGLQVWSHGVYQCLAARPHGEPSEARHHH